MKTVRSFTTNNLVEGHDTYVKFMNARFENLKKEGKKSDILFYKRGGNSNTGWKLSITEYRDVCKWHCITLTYNIWCELVKDHVVPDNNCIQYKKHIEVSDDIMKQFKYRVEQAIKIAKCDYNERLSPHSKKNGTYDACRYLVMYWAYLDLIHDCKTQRYFPNGPTIVRAQRVFGYGIYVNPFFMNGKFNRNAIRDKKEIKEVKSDTTNCIMVEDLDFTHRTFNVLKRACINTLDDILRKSYDDLIKVKDMGKNSLNEIVETLRKQGYEYIDCDGLPQPIKYPRNTDGFDKNKLLVDLIDDRRLTNPLHRSKIHTVGDFLAKSDKELLKIRTFGVVKLKKVKEIVDNYAKQTKEVAEERKGIDISEKTTKNGNKYLHVNVEDPVTRINKLVAEREEIISNYEKKIGEYEARLQYLMEHFSISEKNNRRLEEDLEKARKDIDQLNGEIAHLNARIVKDSDDILLTINKAIKLMKNAGISSLKTDINNFAIDINQKFSIRNGVVSA